MDNILVPKCLYQIAYDQTIGPKWTLHWVTISETELIASGLMKVMNKVSMTEIYDDLWSGQREMTEAIL